MKKRLILHIGMHKTGTSSVQRYFSRNRMMLRRMGVSYPNSIGIDGARQPKHASIFDAISHEADFGSPHPVLGPSATVIGSTADEIESSSGQIGVLSAEGLSGERRVFAEAMASLSDRFDTTVVIFVRRQDHWVESFYKQMVLSREVKEVRSFHQFIEADSTKAHMSYDRIIRWWMDAFGEERVLVKGFHPLGAKRPLMKLLDIAALGRAFRWIPFAHSHENPSAGVEAVEVIRRLNAIGDVAPRDAAACLETQYGRSDVQYLTSEERNNLLESYKEGNRWVLKYMNIDDRSCLAPNMSELGRSRELRWTGSISAAISTNLNRKIL